MSQHKITRRVTVTDSSNIKSIGYAPQSLTLYVTFCNGGTYAYSDVPAHEFGALVSSMSVGGHFSKSVKGLYRERKVS